MSNEKTGFAVLVDLENAGGKVSMLNSIIEKVKIRGAILIGKVYGYTDNYSSLREVLLSNTFTAIPSIRYGSSQKNSLDIQLVIDALEIAYQNPLIDSFCIVSGDSDYTPLVGKLKSMGKHVLGISRSESASHIFINACNEFLFLESVTKTDSKPARRQRARGADDEARRIDGDERLNAQILTILSEQADSDGYVYAAELKNTLLRLHPDFSERNYGEQSFGKLLAALEQKFEDFHIINDNFSVKLSIRGREAESAQLTVDNWTAAFSDALFLFKDEGFDRVDPSILKAAITNKYPGFDEKQLGFKKFSDLLKYLEKYKYILIETSDDSNMLVRIL
ncbi:MAG: NYN domain-containing protein [Oscillospiraceae bacterium]|nr:NYN domain-containing protein [Oscillospiraceae bacterium]